MSDIVERLRAKAAEVEFQVRGQDVREWNEVALMREAADEIERLRPPPDGAGMREALYLMTEDGKSKFMPLREAGRLADSGYSRVEIGRMVLMPDLSVRPMTAAERDEIEEIADRVSSSK